MKTYVVEFALTFIIGFISCLIFIFVLISKDIDTPGTSINLGILSQKEIALCEKELPRDKNCKIVAVPITAETEK